LILDHGKQNFMATGACGGGSRCEEERGNIEEARYSPQGHTPSDLLAPTRPHLLLFLIPQQCHQIMNSSKDEPSDEVTAP
jgi:hypothetical protein